MDSRDHYPEFSSDILELHIQLAKVVPRSRLSLVIFRLYIQLPKLVPSSHLDLNTFKLCVELPKLISSSPPSPKLSFSSLNLSNMVQGMMSSMVQRCVAMWVRQHVCAI